MKPNSRTKTSGEDWLGEIPTHWSAPSLKRLLREPLTYGLNEAAELEERDLPRYLRITDFDDDGKLRDETFSKLEVISSVEIFADGELQSKIVGNYTIDEKSKNITTVYVEPQMVVHLEIIELSKDELVLKELSNNSIGKYKHYTEK